mmetsp:Transcript_469/g.1205  ORF Transcript_469/g.1205 Transcript_469/m.1205 type:complete len:83 (+) Transcript_469:286-534(+)
MIVLSAPLFYAAVRNCRLTSLLSFRFCFITAHTVVVLRQSAFSSYRDEMRWLGDPFAVNNDLIIRVATYSRFPARYESGPSP